MIIFIISFLYYYFVITFIVIIIVVFIIIFIIIFYHFSGIEYDETGIVTAMSKIDPVIPSLNISTATTNCTLVPEELLEQTLDCLAESLKCPIREYR